MMRFGVAVSFCLAALVWLPRDAVMASSLRRTATSNEKKNLRDDSPSIYDCLQAASGGDECHAAFGGQCVWCAEPIYGLCVTASVASKLGNLPFFKCDDDKAAAAADVASMVTVATSHEISAEHDHEQAAGMSSTKNAIEIV